MQQKGDRTITRQGLTASPPRGWLRRIVRLPILLYRLGLGWLLGERFLLLHHVGRKTGQPHKTVVEVIGHEAQSDTYYIVSGWGYGADWYRNLLANPQTTIQVGRRRLAVHAESLSADEGAQVLLRYRREHPLAARELSRLLGLDLDQASADDLKNTVRNSLPVVALRPRTIQHAASERDK